MPTAAVVAVTKTKFPYIKKITVAWTSSDAGAATATLSIFGKLSRLVTVPGTVGDQPTDQYDITLVDALGVDHLKSLGLNRSNVNTEDVNVVFSGTSTNVPVVDGALTFTLANAGNVKKGTAYLYVEGTIA